ncbi:hypothetical protein T01_9212 [Trichinella spiralis]|uniref:Uncharacterized protein n=1 Tax=Trichinella spiralis TaxID=6334 RepID=A0A0V1AZD8_TRISP|nr:hypothetical protein T01_9212 [Trichinella spiralis]
METYIVEDIIQESGFRILSKETTGFATELISKRILRGLITQAITGNIKIERLVNVDNADTVVDVSEPACRVRIQQCTVVTYVVNVLCRCCELPLFGDCVRSSFDCVYACSIESFLVLLSLAQHYSFVNKLCRLSIEFSLTVIVTQVGLFNALDFPALQ